jgi:hypothetical protein
MSRSVQPEVPCTEERTLMIRTIAISFLLISVTACQSTLDTVALSSSFCDEVMPPFTQWDGLPLPPPQTDTTAMYLYPSPIDASRTWAILVDGKHVKARYDIDSQQIAPLVQAHIMPCLKGVPANPKLRGVQTEVKCPLIAGKVRMPVGPGLIDSEGSELLESAPYFVNRTLTWSEVDRQLTDDFEAGLVCPQP